MEPSSTAQPPTKSRRAYDRDKIGKKIRLQMEPWPALTTESALDDVVEKLTDVTTATVERHTPHLRPFPYSKRWFTPDLKTQQTELNQVRRRWQESGAEHGREHARSASLFDDMRQKRRAWTRAIEKAKAAHWKQFLDEAG